MKGPETSMDDKYEELAEQLAPEPRAGGSGRKTRGSKSKTSGRAVQQAVANSQEDRIANAEKVVRRDLTHFPFVEDGLERNLEQINSYSEWVLESLKQGYPKVDLENDIKYKPSTSKVGAGGQNRDRRKTAVRAVHQLTSIYAKSQEEREQAQNKKEAGLVIYSFLEEHLKSAKEFLNDRPTDDSKKEKLMELLTKIYSEKYPETKGN